jgi:poly(3-hydroxybutyrate) depolymerase
MTHRHSNVLANLAAAGAVALLVTRPAGAELLDESVRMAGTTVEYKVVLPDGYDPAQAYPAILVFGGGPQTMGTIEGALDRNFRAEAEKRGYIVVGVAAPNGQLFFQGGDRIFPRFLDKIRDDYKILDGKFHVAGPSNGGIAAMHVAAANPEYFASVTAFPGYLWQPSEKKLRALANVCVFLYVGEHDRYMWHDEMKREADFLTSLGSVARYTVEKGQPHRLETLAGDHASRLFDDFDRSREGCSQ